MTNSKHVLFSIIILILTIASLVAFRFMRTANAAPLSQKTAQATVLNVKQANVYLVTSLNTITALNSNTGATLWTFQPGNTIDPPTTVGHTVYAYVLTSPYATLYALNINTGATLWTFHQNGFLNNPIINNAVYFTVDSATTFHSTLYKLNAATGATLWTFQPGTQLSSAPLMVNGVVYISSANAGPIYALQDSNGQQILQTQSTPYAAISVRAVAGGVLYADGQGPKNSIGLLYAYSATNGAALWQVEGALETVVNTITYIEGGTYANPEMCALNSLTGTQRWCIAGFEFSTAGSIAIVVTGLPGFSALDTSSGTQLWSSQNSFITLHDGVVYTTDATNAIDALNATSGALIWKSIVKNGSFSYFLIANGQIYAESASATTIYSLNVRNGAQIWSFSLPSSVYSLTIINGVIIIATNNNALYALQASGGKLLWHH